MELGENFHGGSDKRGLSLWRDMEVRGRDNKPGIAEEQGRSENLLVRGVGVNIPEHVGVGWEGLSGKWKGGRERDKEKEAGDMEKRRG